MTMHTKASNAWKTVRYVYAKVSGSWQNVGQIYCKSGGTWYPVWSYSWTTGSYGSCSADCGGGTQTRSVTCTRNDGYTMDDAYCTKFVGTKPATSQSCNTQECMTCKYQRWYTDRMNTWWEYIHGTGITSSNGVYSAPCGGTALYIDWENAEIYINTGVSNFDSVTVSGYKYTKGDLKDEYDTEGCMSDPWIEGCCNDHEAYYEVCREAV